MKVPVVLTFNTLLAGTIALGVAVFFALSVFAPVHTPVAVVETGVGRLPCKSSGVCGPIILPHQLYLHPSHGI